ncbi:MAG: NAD-dependent epimerase/dehydratase family protein [Halobacteriota archaeon]
MTVAVVGGNGHIGMELCLLLREAGETPRPLVRNRIGAAFFEAHDIDARVVDVTDDEAAEKALRGVDAVVVSARTDVERQSPSEVKATNRALVTGAVENAPTDAAAILFSSVSAIDPSSFYGHAKRYEEAILSSACASADIPGYALRLGHVLGPRQHWSRTLSEYVGDRDDLELSVAPDRHSNVVHTVTVCDAVLACARRDPEPGTYTVVNVPQWTWQEVFEFYAASGTRMRFYPPETDEQSIARRVVSAGASLLEPYRGAVFRALDYVPDRAYYELRGRYKQRLAAEDLLERIERTRLDLFVFDYESMPGPFLSDLPETRERLDQERAVEAVFGLHGA